MDAYQESNLCKLMRALTYVSGGIYVLLTAVPVLTVLIVDLKETADQVYILWGLEQKWAAVWQVIKMNIPILAAAITLAPGAFLLIAYALNMTDRSRLAVVFALATLVINLVTILVSGFEITGIAKMMEFVITLGMPFVVMAYSSSEGKYRQSWLWLLYADILSTMTIVLAVRSFEALSLVAALSWAVMHVFAFFAMVPLLTVVKHKE